MTSILFVFVQEANSQSSKKQGQKKVTKKEKTSSEQSSDSTTSKNLGVKGLLGGSEKEGNLPLYIKSDNLSLNSKERVFTYEGNVEIDRGDVRITADTVIGKYDEKNQLQMVICKDNVVLTKGEDLRASSNRAVYRVATATVEMTEGPELARQGNVLSADKITVYVNEDRSEADGNVRVKVIKSEEAGSKLKTKETATANTQESNE